MHNTSDAEASGNISFVRRKKRLVKTGAMRDGILLPRELSITAFLHENRLYAGSTEQRSENSLFSPLPFTHAEVGNA